MSKLNILVSYEYIDNKIIDLLAAHQENLNIIIDSGAFTAHTKGKVIDLNNYSNFIKSLKTKIKNFEFIQLDVVFNAQKTRENYKTQLNQGLNPCPVFTRGDDPEYFHELINQDKYVFVGGVQKGENNKGFAKYLLERSKGKKVHYLAFTNQRFIRAYSPYSVDSSSWSRCCRFGFMELYAGHGRLEKIVKKEFSKPLSNENTILLRKLGLNNQDIKALSSPLSWVANWRTSGMTINNGVPQKTYAAYLSVMAHLLQAYELEKFFKTKTFLAVGSWQHLDSIIQAHNELKIKKLICT